MKIIVKFFLIIWNYLHVLCFTKISCASDTPHRNIFKLRKEISLILVQQK